MSILYTIIIFPLVQLIELSFLFIYRIFRNPGISLCGVSLAVTILTLPLYFKAEYWQETERKIQKKLKPGIDKIKAVFSGDEQYMILSAYYRQNNYHPIYALRSSFGLLIQIPFFIAAYIYISSLGLIHNYSFLGIKNLGIPDSMLKIDNVSINILPILMTAINIVSTAVYTKGLALKEKVQLYGMSLIFLIILYNSPSGLVLYWILNNVFSLIKNIIQRYKIPFKTIYIIFIILLLFFDLYILFFHGGYIVKRLLVFVFSIIVSIFPVVFRYRLRLKNNPAASFNPFYQIFPTKKDFFLSLLILFILCGFVIPSSLIESSVPEFSFIENYKTPFLFLLNTLLQSFGIFLFWPGCIFLLFNQKIKSLLSLFFTLFFMYALANTFLVRENFGFLTNSLVFSEPKPFLANLVPVFTNIAVLLLITFLFFLLVFFKNKTVLPTIRIITLISLLALSVINTIKINQSFQIFNLYKNSNQDNGLNTIRPFFSFSQRGKNVLLIMLDRAMPGYLPVIFEEKPDLLKSFSGFTFYPNCISFADHTLVGAPPIYGGYEYTPLAINNTDNKTLFEKHKEAYLLLPLLFNENKFSVFLNDPPFDNFQQSNLGIFREFPDIHAENLCGKYTNLWLSEHSDISSLNISGLLKNNLIRFSFFKISPLVFRSFIYDKADWLTTEHLSDQGADGALTISTIDNYAFLDYLAGLTRILPDNSDTFNEVYSNLTHDMTFFQNPDYNPINSVTDRGNGPFSFDSHYHVNMASLMLLGKWFTFLKDEGVYNNTRIIIVSDHGAGISSKYPGNIKLPNGESLQAYHSLLLFKDFGAEGDLITDTAFMTNADAPFLATNRLIPNAVNPFTGKAIESRKKDGITLTTIGALDSRYHTKYHYRINDDQWLHVKDDIFIFSNWSSAAIKK
jgi:YidC/Oxa1 family membrane protein insertase